MRLALMIAAAFALTACATSGGDEGPAGPPTLVVANGQPAPAPEGAKDKLKAREQMFSCPDDDD